MLLSLSDIHKTYRDTHFSADVLKGVSLDLQAGEALALMGESGSGKSTLLHIAGGLDLPDRGHVTLQGGPVNVASDAKRAAIRARSIGIVFQQFNLIPSLTVAANIAFQARLADQYDAQWCADLAARMGLTEHLRKYPEALSGGQQQRVAIARALAGRPPLVLADEPTGNLDEATSDTVMALFREIAEKAGTAILMVTHSEKHAGEMGRVLRLAAGKIAA